MGKIVKFCTSCDEGFAEKFGFCPNCGSTLQAFEMNPVDSTDTPAPVEAAPPEPEVIETSEAPVEEVVASEPVVETPIVDPDPEPIAEVVKPVAAAAPVFARSEAIDLDRNPTNISAEREAYTSDGGFYVTVIEEKNVTQRNTLLLGTLGFMICALMFGVVYSIFSKDLDIGAINDDIFNAVLVDNVPMTVEEEVKQREKNKGGGGGGGGREEKDPASQGDLADQSKTPTRPPNVNTMKSDTPMLQTPTTEGTMKFPKIYGKWGDPNGAPGLSNGQGSGGGLGSGRGTGQGSGNGTGAGSGNGSGFGAGNGNGNGDGDGNGNDGITPPPPKPAGVTQALRILGKPKPSYTDSARQNQIQGTVILRVTFLASGAIGSISAVKGLPNGLTEQAIAAARSIRFEPAKRDGVGQAVTKQVEYTFSIY